MTNPSPQKMLAPPVAATPGARAGARVDVGERAALQLWAAKAAQVREAEAREVQAREARAAQAQEALEAPEPSPLSYLCWVHRSRPGN